LKKAFHPLNIASNFKMCKIWSFDPKKIYIRLRPNKYHIGNELEIEEK
jgi:hypothetical protein